MPDINVLAVLVAAFAVFVLASVYYPLLAGQWAQVSDRATRGRPAPWKVALELARALMLAAVVAGLAHQGNIDDWTGGLALGITLWIAFPFVLLTGSMIWENTPPKLAAIHGGDWLIKLLVIAVIVSVWS